MPQEGGDNQEMQGEFRRDVRTAREGSADFSAAPMEEDDDEYHDQVGVSFVQREMSLTEG